MMKLKLNKGMYTIIDAEDYEKVSKLNWYVSSYGYVVGYGKMVDGKRKMYRLQRYIMNAPNEKVVDHKNGNRLDNRKSNLRICTSAENNRNIPKVRKSKNRYKGVRLEKRVKGPNVYRAYIYFNKKYIYLGLFESEKEAAKAYNRAALKYFGEFARLNVLD